MILDAFPVGSNRAERARVLLRFALDHQAEAQVWFQATDGQHADGFDPSS